MSIITILLPADVSAALQATADERHTTPQKLLTDYATTLAEAWQRAGACLDHTRRCHDCGTMIPPKCRETRHYPPSSCHLCGSLTLDAVTPDKPLSETERADLTLFLIAQNL
jgi:hypothetical protein